MLGLFGTLNLATRALATQRQGTEIAGHNLANVNNPAYARQRLEMATSMTIHSPAGPQGTGVDGVAIRQLRDVLLDRQITGETSIEASLRAQQDALRLAQSSLGQLLDRQASGTTGTEATSGVGGQHGLAEELSGFLNAFQSLSTDPTSASERQILLMRAQDLATQFNQVDVRIADVHSTLNQAIESDVDRANTLVADIARLNEQIARIEIGGQPANDLRDARQERLEQLASLVQVSSVEQPTGAIEVSVGGVVLNSGGIVHERLQAYDVGDGRTAVRALNSGIPLDPGGGSIGGTIEARDGALARLRADVRHLASTFISEVNAVHSAGFGLGGTTGAAFFTGTDAASIAVNADLLEDPSRIQASGAAGASGDNTVALRIAQLADRPVAALRNQTFHEAYGGTVAALGQSIASLNSQIDNQQIVGSMLARQRDSISGVSIDEEMTDLIRYQKAFEASARLVSIVDEMLDTVLSMKR